MAVMPGATYAPINYDGVPEMQRYDGVVFHTIVGHDPAPAAHCSVGSNGELTQSRDTLYQSAACYQGNPRLIAVETEDKGDPFPEWTGGDVPAWTDAQCNTNARIAAWAHLEHDIPLVECPDSKPTSRGIGWHRLGIDGNFISGVDYPGRVPGGEIWTKYPGKECPGNRRIRQVKEKVIPLARLIVSLPPAQRARVIAGTEPIPTAPAVAQPVTEEEFDMERIIVVWGKRPSDGTGYAGLCGVVMPGPDGGREFLDVSTSTEGRSSADANTKLTGVNKWDTVTVPATVWESYKARFQQAPAA